jgi:predicted transcriptional regulator
MLSIEKKNQPDTNTSITEKGKKIIKQWGKEIYTHQILLP